MKWKSREHIKCKPHLWFAWKPVRVVDVDTPAVAKYHDQEPDTMVWLSLVYRKRDYIGGEWEYFTVAEWIRQQLLKESTV